MAERKLAWNKPGEGESILRDEPRAENAADTPAPEPAEQRPPKREIHRLTVDIYEDQFKKMSLRKIVDDAGSVTDQVREAIDRYLESVGGQER